MTVRTMVCLQHGSGTSPEHKTARHATELVSLKLTNTTCSQTGDVGERRPPTTTKLEFPTAGFPSSAESPNDTVAWHIRDSRRSLSTVYVSVDIDDRFQTVMSDSRRCRPDDVTPNPPTAATQCWPFISSLLMVWPNRWHLLSVPSPINVNSAALQHKPCLQAALPQSGNLESRKVKDRLCSTSEYSDVVPSTEGSSLTLQSFPGFSGRTSPEAGKWRDCLLIQMNVPQSETSEFRTSPLISETRGHNNDTSCRQEPLNAVNRT